MIGANEVGLREASEVLGLHYMTVYRYVRTGRLAARREGGEWLVRRSDLEALAREPQAPVERGRRGRPRHEARVGRLVTTLLAGDEPGAWTVISEAVASGATASAISIELIGAAMQQIGERWERGAASVADEHRASVIAHQLIGRAGAHVSRRGRHRGRIVLGAPAGELHSLPSALLADVLRSEGFEVHDLGANVPTEDFVAFVASSGAGVGGRCRGDHHATGPRPHSTGQGAAAASEMPGRGGWGSRDRNQPAPARRCRGQPQHGQRRHPPGRRGKGRSSR